MNISVLFQNSDFVAVDKAPGISIHNNEDPTNLLRVLEQELHKPKLFPVHRLDKETSGVQIVAFNESTARSLAEEFQSHSVKKMYCGLLRGELKAKTGIWKEPLTDKSEGRKQPAGQSRDRVACETRFRVLESSPYFSFCEFDLITGRQHQIRKHAALARHALVGDPRYGDPRYNQKISQLYKIERMLLHCARVEILGRVFTAPMPDWIRLCRTPNSVQN